MCDAPLLTNKTPLQGDGGTLG